MFFYFVVCGLNICEILFEVFNMDEVTDVVNPHEEVKKLQDMVRKLELQNEMLRTQQNMRNGVIETRIICDTGSTELGGKKASAESERIDEEILEIKQEELSDEETW